MAYSPLRLAALLGVAAAFPAAALAADPPSRQSTLVIYGNDPCPTTGPDNEVVVCARWPEEERYRIPRRIREVRDEPCGEHRVQGLRAQRQCRHVREQQLPVEVPERAAR